jgi:hypothetical protein
MLRRVDADDHLGVCQLDDGVQFPLWKPGRDRLRDRAELPTRDGRAEKLDAIRQCDRHVVPGRDAECREGTGGAIREPVEFTPSNRALLVGDAGSVRVGGRVVGEPRRVRDQRHGCILSRRGYLGDLVSSATKLHSRATASGSMAGGRRSTRRITNTVRASCSHSWQRRR